MKQNVYIILQNVDLCTIKKLAYFQVCALNKHKYTWRVFFKEEFKLHYNDEMRHRGVHYISLRLYYYCYYYTYLLYLKLNQLYLFNLFVK